jgi:septum formation protein
VVEALIEEGDVMWCAGGLMVEHPLVAPLVKKMVGPIDSVMGLPKDLLLRLLLEASK